VGLNREHECKKGEQGRPFFHFIILDKILHPKVERNPFPSAFINCDSRASY
jgi:hypothetical protein